MPLEVAVTYVPIFQIRKLKSRDHVWIVGMGSSEQG